MGISQHSDPAKRQQGRDQERRQAGEQRKRSDARSSSRDIYASAPDRSNRPSAEELGGISEYQVDSSSDREEGDPMGEVQRVLPNVPEEGDLTPPLIAVSEPRTGVPLEDDSVAPDELGSDFLRGAVQDPRPPEPEEPLPAQEGMGLSNGEQRMLDQLVSSFQSDAGLVTEMPYRADKERELSDLGLEAVRWARAKGAETHEEVRKLATEYLSRRGEQMEAAAAEDAAAAAAAAEGAEDETDLEER